MSAEQLETTAMPKMQTVVVEETLDAPIEHVFAVLSDHENYKQFRDVVDSRLLRPGHKDKNGVGAVRRIRALRAVLDEEIPVFEPPNRFEYRVIRSRPFPLEHRLGLVELTAVGDQTRVRWESVFRINVPVLGNMLSAQAAKMSRKSFRRILQDAEELVQRQLSDERDEGRL